MKRIITLLLSAILLCTAFPFASAAAETETVLDADHVLIYNPLPYANTANTLFTGTIRTASEDAQTSGDAPFRPGLHRTGRDFSKKAAGEDTHAFWVIDLATYQYNKYTFRLAAESEHCCIWTKDDDAASFADEQLETLTEQFESVIYPTDTGTFGPFRDLGGDGKLHIVAYAMSSLSVCGFFDTYDLYSEEEIAVIDPDDAESYNCLPIINVNTRMADDMTTVLCTLAHEFQHLILRSAVLASPANANQLGNETSVGLWLNEGFSMAAEELCYPGAVEQQGYLTAYGSSDKVRYGMSYQHFDTTAADVGAYGQSFLFAQYLKAQCGDGVFGTFLEHWRSAAAQEALTEANVLSALLTDAQKTELSNLAAYTDGVLDTLGSDAETLLSEFALAFHLAIVLKAEQGVYSIGDQAANMPLYTGTGRKLEGGGAILLETNGTFRVPQDAQPGLVFVAIGNGEITGSYTVPEPEEGFYVIAAERDGDWFAVPAQPCADKIIKPVSIDAPQDDGSVPAQNVRGLIFSVTRGSSGYRIACDDRNGEYVFTRTDTNKQTLAVREGDTRFDWLHFADGADRLQADGYYGRAVLYGAMSGGFEYSAPAYFEHASFSHVRMLRVTYRAGDANLDGRLTAADAAMILRSLVGLSYLNAPMRAAGDVDRDAELTAEDAARILRIVVQLESEGSN